MVSGDTKAGRLQDVKEMSHRRSSNTESASCRVAFTFSFSTHLMRPHEHAQVNGNLVVVFDDGTVQEINRTMVTSSSLPTYRCPVGACLGGENFSCAEGHHGPVCGLCNATRGENGMYYAWSGSSCVQCEDDSSGSVTVIVSVPSRYPPHRAFWQSTLKFPGCNF